MSNEYNTRALFEKLLKDNGFNYSIKDSYSEIDNCIVESEYQII